MREVEVLLQEYERRQLTGKKSGFWIQPELSPLQQDFINDTNRFKIARACRQSGKTFTILQYLIYKAMEKPKARCLLIGLTMKNVKELGWDSLKDTLLTNNIEHNVYEAVLGISFPNGSKIKLVAADQLKSIDRLRGSQWDLVCVDECAFSSEADKLITVLLPTLAIRYGSLVMTSSPGPCRGFFYDADQGEKRRKWSHFFWRMQDNPVMQLPAIDDTYLSRAEEELATILEMRFGGDKTHPDFRREYLGEWVQDDSVLLFHFSRVKNLVQRKDIPVKDLTYVAAIDLGWQDSNAISIIGIDIYNKKCYFVETWKQNKITIDEIAQVVQRYIDKYQIRLFGSDIGGYGKGITEEMRIKYRIPLIPATKHDKCAAIAMMNSDFYARNIYVCDDLQDLQQEWLSVEKDPETGIERKNAKCDIADSALYAYRIALQYLPRNESRPVELSEHEQVYEKMKKQQDLEELYG